MEVPRLEVKLELQLLAYAKATAMWDLSCVHSSWKCCIPDPLSKARDWTRILTDISQICFHWTTIGAPSYLFKLYFCYQYLADLYICQILIFILFYFIFLSFCHFLGCSHGIWRFPKQKTKNKKRGYVFKWNLSSPSSCHFPWCEFQTAHHELPTASQREINFTLCV